MVRRGSVMSLKDHWAVNQLDFGVCYALGSLCDLGQITDSFLIYLWGSFNTGTWYYLYMFSLS